MLHAHCLGSTSPAARAAGASSPAPAAEHWHTRLFPAPDGSRTEVTVAHNGRSRIVLRRSGATAQPLTASIQPHAAPLADALICQFERPGRGGAAAIVALRAGGRGIEIVAPDAGGCSHQLPCAVRFVRGEPLPGGGALLQRDEAHAFETPNTAEGTTAAALWLLSQPLAPPRPLQLVDSAIIQLPPQARIQLLCAGPDDTVLLQVSHGDSSNQLVQAQLHRGRLQLEPLVVFKAHGAPLRTAWARRHGAVVAEGVTTDNKWLQFVQRGSPSAGEQVTEVAGVVSVVPVNLLYPEQPDGKIKLLPEVLVLRANGQLEYFVGGESVALVDGVTFGSDHEALVELRDSVNNRFTAVSSQGAHFRFMLNVLPEQPTARRLLSYILQLAGRVSDSVIVQVLRRWLTERDRAVAANEDEWTALSRAVLRVLGLTPTDLPGERSGNPVSAFDAVRSLGLLGELSHSADLPASQLSSPGAVVTTPDHFQLFNALHLLLQDWSLAAQLEQQDAPLLAQVLSRMASGLGLGKHAAWYHAVYGTAHVPVAPSAATLALPTADADQALPPALTPTDPCFDIWAWLEARCAGHAVSAATVATHLRSLLPHLSLVFQLCAAVPPGIPLLHGDTVVKLVPCLAQMELTPSSLAILAPGLAGLLQVAVVLAHDRPPMYDADSIACYTLMDRQDLVRLQLAARVQRAKGPLALPPVCRFSTGSRRAVHTPSNGIAWNALTALRFSLDHRLREVERLLNSSVTNWVRVKQEPGMTDHFLLAEQQSRLLAISLRTMAMSVGRGMAVLNTAEPLITQALHVPELELRGRLHPLGSHFELDSNTVSPAVKQWPFFHNGVAAALRLCPRGGSKASITAWLARHDIAGSAEATAQHAGLLMGLGLTGHLLELGSVTLHSFLSKCHEPTSVGILLGLAAAKHASMDADIVRVLSIHVPSLLPPSSAEVDVDLMVQAAAMVGLGLVYEGSCHRRMIEMMLLEMGRPPPLTVSGTLDRESYALASGIGLGLVLLGKGGSAALIDDVSLMDTLRRYFEGGPKLKTASMSEESLGRVWEPPAVNIHVTAPAAIMALTLAFLQTNNETAASMLRIPNTLALLEQTRADFLMLRALGTALIHWHSIRPTVEWFASQFPAALLAVATKLKQQLGPVPKHSAQRVRQLAYLHVSAGVAMAVGLRYAGTASETALATVMRAYQTLDLFARGLGDGENIRTPRAVMLCAMAMIMCSTGDLRVMRLLRKLHADTGNQSFYGFHMATHMALGLLFLGGNGLTLARTPSAIAALLIAFYPRFPATASDNHAHFQALRHLYVLATVPRALTCVNIRTESPELVPLTLEVEPESQAEADLPPVMHLVSPIILPVAIDKIRRITVDDERHFGFSLYPSTNAAHHQALQQEMCIYVKPRPGVPPLQQDTKVLGDYIAQSERLLGAQSAEHLQGRTGPGDFAAASALWQPLKWTLDVDQQPKSEAEFFAERPPRTLPSLRHLAESSPAAEHVGQAMLFARHVLLRLEAALRPNTGESNMPPSRTLLRELRQMRVILAGVLQAQDTQPLARLYYLQCADWHSDVLTHWEQTHPDDFTAALAFLSSPRQSAPLQPSQALALAALGLQPVAGVLDGLQDIFAEIAPMEHGALVLQALLLESFTHLRVDEARRLVRLLVGFFSER